jgi:hypothetical protein
MEKMKPTKTNKRTKTSTPQNGEVKEAQRTVTSTPKTTIVEAKIDVGFGNNQFLRGQGAAGLSWDRGIPLSCVDGKTWQWSGKADDKLKFKLLLNDTVWAKGEDVVAAPGQKVQVAPAF